MNDLPLIAIAGNPNVGKTSVFNRLTGEDLKVGNYPGVTVERTERSLRLGERRVARLMDIPGTYSLSARSAEEQIAMQAIAGIPPMNPPDLLVLVIDATQLTRNLYLALQVIEIGVPCVIALNMVDMLKRRGQDVDAERLEAALGIPVVPVSGVRGVGIEELRRRIGEVLDEPARGRAGWRWHPATTALGDDIRHTAACLPDSWRNGREERSRALALWALLSLDEDDELHGIPAELREMVAARRQGAIDQGREIEAEVIQGRYRWIDEHAKDFLRELRPAGRTRTERVDAVLLHPLLGFAAFLAVMGILFQSLFSWSDPAIAGIESAFSVLAGAVEQGLPPGLFTDFLVDGLISGVGSVVVFLPQILLLFFFIGLMEDTGYMARVAFLMDRIMRALGLHGRAFVPMLSGYACAVPAILATRTMERQRDRMLTMMVIPLMTCSARLPVYTLLIAALIPPSKFLGLLPTQGLLMVALYAFSTLMALAAAAVLGRTLFQGKPVPLILELPPYRVPHWLSVLRMMWQRGSVFLREAGGIILLCTIVLWVLLSFPQNPTLDTDYDALRARAEAQLEGDALQQRLASIDAEESGDVLRSSFGGRLGRTIEPAIAPLGFDWKIGVGLIGAFAAREVFVSTMGVVYGVGEEVDEVSPTLRQRIRSERRDDGRPVYTPLVGLSLMIFIALSCQCMSTLAAVRRETRSWRWPAFLFAYMTALAWIFSFAIYQGGRLLGLA